MEPIAAQRYAEMAANMFLTGVPVGDKRKMYSDSFGLDFGSVFRVDEKGSLNKSGAVQVIHINYPIAKYDYCGDPGTQTLQQLVMAANADETVKSIVLWIDSPGGQADGTEDLANTIKASAKPVVAYTDQMMASASYWIGSAAKEVIAKGSNNGWNNTIGSIGTTVMWKDDREKMAKEGVKIHTVFATASKDKWGDYFEMMDGKYDKLIEQLDGYNESFLSAVQSNRAGKLNLEKENVLTGKTYNAKQALKFGLIDKIGTFEMAVKRSLQLSKQQQLFKMENNNTSPFQNTLVAAGAESFEVVDGGFLLTEENLNAIEAKLIALNESVANVLTTSAQHEAKIDELNAAIEANANTITEKENKIVELEAEVARLKAGPAGSMSTTTKEEDEIGAQGIIGGDPINAEAARLRAIKNSK